MLAADFALGEVLWSILAIGLFVIWFWLLISIFSDLFRDQETSGGMKALWSIFVIFLEKRQLLNTHRQGRMTTPLASFSSLRFSFFR